MRIAVRGDAPCELGPIRAAVRAALRPFALPPDAQLTIAFVDDDTMRALNARHRGKHRTTDVLSFGQRLRRGAKGAAASAQLRRDVDDALDVGDIVISGAVAEGQARRKRHPLEHEVAFLAAHGALHLLGFDDGTPEGYREMVQLGTAAVERAWSRQ